MKIRIIDRVEYISLVDLKKEFEDIVLQSSDDQRYFNELLFYKKLCNSSEHRQASPSEQDGETFVSGEHNTGEESKSAVHAMSDGKSSPVHSVESELKHFSKIFLGNENMTSSNALKCVVSNYETKTNPQQKIGNFTQTKLEVF